MSIQNNFPAIRPSLNLDFANTKILDPKVTFTRAASAVYYDGVTTAKAEQNLLPYSQEFDNAVWGKTGTVVIANTSVAPDGTTTADTLTENLTTVDHTIASSSTVTTGLTYSFSLFVKIASGSRYLGFRGFGAGGAGQYPVFNITAGTVEVSGSLWTNTSIIDAGNGWYRCSSTVTALGTANPLFHLMDSPTTLNYAGDGTSGFFIWGAQLEQRDSVTAYTPTTTQPITNYVPQLLTAASGVARFDHNPTTSESLGLLVEEQRTNLVLQSEDFTTTWAPSGTSVTPNIIVAPNGTLTGDKLVETATTAVHRIDQVPATATSDSFSYSVYAKAAERTIVELRVADVGFATGSRAYATFDLVAGTTLSGNISASNVSSSMQSVGNGWWRCTITATLSVSGTSTFVYVTTRTNTSLLSAGESYTGDGYSGIYIWGAQLEAGAFPTSCIPTVASQVTRAADAASMTGANFSSWYRADEGTFVSTSAAVNTGTFRRIVSANNGSANSNIYIAHSNDNARGFVIVNNVAEASFTAATFNGDFGTVALAYKFNDVGFSFNGALATDTVVTIPVVDRLSIGVNETGTTNFLNGHIRRISYYPKRLSNVELQGLTTS